MPKIKGKSVYSIQKHTNRSKGDKHILLHISKTRSTQRHTARLSSLCGGRAFLVGARSRLGHDRQTFLSLVKS